MTSASQPAQLAQSAPHTAPRMGQGRHTLSAAAAMVEDARRDLDRLDRHVADHVAAASSGWVGQGGGAFSALGRAWSERQRSIVAALDGFAASLRSTERDTLATDEHQSAAFARFQRRLG